MPVPQLQTVPNAIEQKLGIVVSVDHEKGILTLVHSDGTCSHLTADPSLLDDLRIGGPVQALVKGTVVWTLRCL
jgi:hypothetical protein